MPSTAASTARRVSAMAVVFFLRILLYLSKVLFAFSADVFPASQRTLISGALNAAGNIGAALGGLMSFGQSFSCRMDNFFATERL